MVPAAGPWISGPLGLNIIRNKTGSQPKAIRFLYVNRCLTVPFTAVRNAHLRWESIPTGSDLRDVRARRTGRLRGSRCSPPMGGARHKKNRPIPQEGGPVVLSGLIHSRAAVRSGAHGGPPADIFADRRPKSNGKRFFFVFKPYCSRTYTEVFQRIQGARKKDAPLPFLPPSGRRTPGNGKNRAVWRAERVFRVRGPARSLSHRYGPFTRS